MGIRMALLFWLVILATIIMYAYTFPKTNSSPPENRPQPKRKLLSQPPICQWLTVNFREGAAAIANLEGFILLMVQKSRDHHLVWDKLSTNWRGFRQPIFPTQNPWPPPHWGGNEPRCHWALPVLLVPVTGFPLVRCCGSSLPGTSTFFSTFCGLALPRKLTNENLLISPENRWFETKISLLKCSLFLGRVDFRWGKSAVPLLPAKKKSYPKLLTLLGSSPVHNPLFSRTAADGHTTSPSLGSSIRIKELTLIFFTTIAPSSPPQWARSRCFPSPLRRGPCRSWFQLRALHLSHLNSKYHQWRSQGCGGLLSRGQISLCTWSSLPDQEANAPSREQGSSIPALLRQVHGFLSLYISLPLHLISGVSRDLTEVQEAPFSLGAGPGCANFGHNLCTTEAWSWAGGAARRLTFKGIRRKTYPRLAAGCTEAGCSPQRCPDCSWFGHSPGLWNPWTLRSHTLELGSSRRQKLRYKASSCSHDLQALLLALHVQPRTTLRLGLPMVGELWPTGAGYGHLNGYAISHCTPGCGALSLVQITSSGCLIHPCLKGMPQCALTDSCTPNPGYLPPVLGGPPYLPPGQMQPW